MPASTTPTRHDSPLRPLRPSAPQPCRPPVSHGPRATNHRLHECLGPGFWLNRSTTFASLAHSSVTAVPLSSARSGRSQCWSIAGDHTVPRVRTFGRLFRAHMSRRYAGLAWTRFRMNARGAGEANFARCPCRSRDLRAQERPACAAVCSHASQSGSDFLARRKRAPWQDWTCRQGKQGWECNLACAAGQHGRGRLWWRLPRMASRARHETQGFVRLPCPRPGWSEPGEAGQQSQGPGQSLSASCLDGTLSAATWPADPWPLPSRAPEPSFVRRYPWGPPALAASLCALVHLIACACSVRDIDKKANEHQFRTQTPDDLPPRSHSSHGSAQAAENPPRHDWCPGPGPQLRARGL